MTVMDNDPFVVGHEYGHYNQFVESMTGYFSDPYAEWGADRQGFNVLYDWMSGL
jgi:hypothetical protein